jgi:hypothetical protein
LFVVFQSVFWLYVMQNNVLHTYDFLVEVQMKTFRVMLGFTTYLEYEIEAECGCKALDIAKEQWPLGKEAKHVGTWNPEPGRWEESDMVQDESGEDVEIGACCMEDESDKVCADCGAIISYDDYVENAAQCSAPSCGVPLCPVCISKYLYEGSGSHVCKKCADELRSEGEVITEEGGNEEN